MRCRALRLVLVVFEALWLNVIVPGHQRGAVALPGEPCPACQPQVATSEPCCDDPPFEKQPARPQKDPAAHCAICYFAARLSTPVVIDLTLPPLRLLEVRPPVAGDVRTYCPTTLPYDGRGPPAAV